MNFTVNIYKNLNNKYQSKFNFYFSKSVNEIIFNQTTSLSTISFKDAAIYAETIEYLKRQYFIINEIGVQQIFQRIHILAGFYSGAVLLRYEYPMMIVTKTKYIFLKRLKRNKKMLTEEGSSDQSKSNTLSRSIQLHTNTFLDSVKNSELSKKTAQLRDELFPQFEYKNNNQISFDSNPHDIYEQQVPSTPIKEFQYTKNHQSQHNNKKQSHQSVNSQQSLADKLLKLSKHISLNQMVQTQAMELNLACVQTQMNHLIYDFDQFDKQLTITNYQKLRVNQSQNLKYNQNKNHYIFNHNQNYQIHNNQNQKQYQQISLKNAYDYEEIKKDHRSTQKNAKNSKIFITPLDQNGKQYINHEKTLQNRQNDYQKLRRISKQMQNSAIQRQLTNKNIYYQNQKPQTKMSAFYQTKKSAFLQSQDDKYQHNQQSYRTLQRFNPININKAHQHQIKDQYIIQNRQSIQQPVLQRHRSNNIFNFKKNLHAHLYGEVQTEQKSYRKNIQNYPHIRFDTQNISYHRQSKQDYQNIRKVQTNDHSKRMVQNIIQNKNSFQKQLHRNGYDSFNRNGFEDKYVTQFQTDNYINQKGIHSPRFREIQQQIPNDNMNMKSYPRNTINNTKNLSSHLPLSNQKQLLINNGYKGYNEQYYDMKVQDKQQKKKRIRQKAAQLLSRVKSQQYLTARIQTDYIKRY